MSLMFLKLLYYRSIVQLKSDIKLSEDVVHNSNALILMMLPVEMHMTCWNSRCLSIRSLLVDGKLTKLVLENTLPPY